MSSISYIRFGGAAFGFPKSKIRTIPDQDVVWIFNRVYILANPDAAFVYLAKQRDRGTCRSDPFPYRANRRNCLGILSLSSCSFRHDPAKKSGLLNKTLNDERIQHTRLKSFAVGFWVVVMLQAPLFYLAPLVGMTVQGVILTNIFFGVTSALLAFLIFERAQ